MHTPFYFLISVSGLCFLWVLWDWAAKSFFLDFFRERVFELRFALFQMGMAGELSFDSDVYRQVEVLLCGLLRFSHRMTLLTYFFSKLEQERSAKQKDHVDVAEQLALKIARLEPAAQVKLGKILRDVRRAILLYMAFTSLLFLCGSVVLLVARLLGVWRPDEARKISGVIEQEAYRAESRRQLTLSHA